MNAYSSKDDLDFSLGNVSYIGPAYEDAPTASVKPHGFRDWLATFWVAILEWRQHQAVLQEMRLMTDRELADVGLTRSDLVRVFDPAFAADRARGRDYIAY